MAYENIRELRVSGSAHGVCVYGGKYAALIFIAHTVRRLRIWPGGKLKMFAFPI